MTEDELRAIYGEHFRNAPVEYLEHRFACHTLLHKINHSKPEEAALRIQAFKELLGEMEDGVHIVPPFYCDIGKNIEIGEKTFINNNCTVLDGAPIKIGKRTWIASGVQISAASHPVDYMARRSEVIAKPITIGDDVWLGAGAIICPGVTIGDRTVIGAGSIVTRDIPADVVAYGNPCKVQRSLSNQTDE